MKPIIGILAEVDAERAARVQSTYVKVIEDMGGFPILLPYVAKEESFERFAELCDGFFFSGGADIHPKRYGEEVKPRCGEIYEYRDELEIRAFEKIVGTKRSILAICRGAQLVNVALGGTLYQDIPSEISTTILHRQIEDKFEFSHEVNILEGTPLCELFEAERIRANSFHHQAIKELGAGLRVMAKADDGIIEAVYSTEHPYLRAYQWHPERLYEKDGYNRKIFEDFIAACKGNE